MLAAVDSGTSKAVGDAMLSADSFDIGQLEKKYKNDDIFKVSNRTEKNAKDLDYKNITGEVFLYRPSNQQLDFDFPIVLSGSNLLIPDKELMDGRWNITIEFTYNNEDYLYKKAIVY
jgi:hypothetical protein